MFPQPEVEENAGCSVGGVFSLSEAQPVFQCFTLNADKAETLFHSATTANQLMSSPATTPPGTLGQK